MNFISIAKKYKKTIILDELEDDRVFKAAKSILKNKIARLMVIKNKKSSKNCKLLKKFGAIVIDPSEYVNEMAQKFYELRKDKINIEISREIMEKSNYLSVMLVKEGIADGYVSGAIHATADVLRPAFQILKSSHKASGAFIMKKGRKYFIFADCAANINPSEEDLAYIAHDSVKTAKMLKIKPKVAFLSYSTNGSGKGAEKMRKAWELFKKLHPGVESAGEIQADAAIDKKTREIKWKKCPLKNDANVLIFPDLNSGNIAYKLVQRLGGYEAIGPIVQGLEKPVNDLSRGCCSKEIVDLVAITAIQSNYK